MAQDQTAAGHRYTHIIRKGILRGVVEHRTGRPDVSLVTDGTDPESLVEALDAGYTLVHISNTMPEPNELTPGQFQLFVMVVLKRPQHVVRGFDWDNETAAQMATVGLFGAVDD